MIPSRHDLTWMEEDIRFALMNDIDFMVWGVYHGEEIEIFQKAIDNQRELMGSACKNQFI
jgi:hypothetical protein